MTSAPVTMRSPGICRWLCSNASSVRPAIWLTALDDLCAKAIDLVRGGAAVLLLTDRNSNGETIPIPMAMATGAVHHALTRAGVRTFAGLAVEAGDCRDLHHAAVLLGMGAGAVCPWLALETARGLNPEKGEANLLHAFDLGLAKIMSKMGISVVDSYRGAHLFDCIGLSPEVVDRCFFGTPAPLGGIGFAEIEANIRQVWTNSQNPPAEPSEESHPGARCHHHAHYDKRSSRLWLGPLPQGR